MNPAQICRMLSTISKLPYGDQIFDAIINSKEQYARIPLLYETQSEIDLRAATLQNAGFTVTFNAVRGIMIISWETTNETAPD